jgi:hypothetical protein
MLSLTERDRIRRNGYCSYHNVGLWSLTEGEPFIKDDLLYYFDGRRLFLCGFSLDRSAAGVGERIRSLAKECYRRLPVELLVYCGPEDVSFRRVCPHRQRLIGKNAANVIGAELVVDCATLPDQPRLRRWIRSQGRLGVEVRVRATGGWDLEANHRRLIEQFYATREITPYLVDIAFLLPALTRLVDVHWLDAFYQGELCGLAVMADAFAETDVGVFMATDPAHLSASDCLYAAVLDFARERGKRYVNLGASPSEGVYRYKQKWGGKPVVPPYWLCEWSSGDLARISFNSWPSRLVQFDFRPAVSTARLESPHDNPSPTPRAITAGQ